VTESGIVDALVAAVRAEQLSNSILLQFEHVLAAHRFNRCLFQGYGGVVVLDDIRAVKWPLMQEYWRNGVPASVTKVDVTEYGHSTGTGALVFDRQKTNIVIAD
jgi:hypothetical protein